MVQAFVPLEMQREVGAVAPLLGVLRDPFDAILEPALHLGDVRDGVRGPDVCTVQLYRAAPSLLRLTIVAGLLECVRVAAQHKAVARLISAPEWEHASDAFAHPVALTKI